MRITTPSLFVTGNKMPPAMLSQINPALQCVSGPYKIIAKRLFRKRCSCYSCAAIRALRGQRVFGATGSKSYRVPVPDLIRCSPERGRDPVAM